MPTVLPTDAIARLVFGPANTPGRTLRRLRAPSLAATVAGRVALVTGASSGVGASVARRLAAAGATVLLVARSADALAVVADEIAAAGGRAEVRPCDLADSAAVATLAADVVAAHGGVDVLVNNAGRSIRRRVAQSVERGHDYRRTMQINYFGAVDLTLALLPAMRERGGGRIVNVLSTAVHAGVPRFSAYTASKTALEGFSRCLSLEERSHGIRVTTVNLGLVRTPMIEPTAAFADAPAQTPDDAARLVLEAIVTSPARLTTRMGAALAVMVAVAPTATDALLHAAYRRGTA
ncbi:SDR family NAD(P)-dependent oxidoreductase [Patulibacter defluvii]|uniref:SDR family NAD(P)-dependent oxidoreductase n=1 Tax=Patulibacter defluvii TaxID=3095358 RepID=UPI002A757428|nr:SDR family NAD(P)-dependent oxidoreductase [Patulibacter sp. DM4]